VERGSPAHGGVSTTVTGGRVRSHSGEVLQVWRGEKVAPQHENGDRTEPMACSQKMG
jgi:hypothetical protein